MFLFWIFKQFEALLTSEAYLLLKLCLKANEITLVKSSFGVQHILRYIAFEEFSNCINF